jgi:membrane protein implicated in regulation of membrane protease activity
MADGQLARFDTFLLRWAVALAVGVLSAFDALPWVSGHEHFCPRPRLTASMRSELDRNACGAAIVAWIVWLIVAAVLGVAELATTTFALGIIAVGALVAAAVGATHLSLPFQLLAFVVASAAGLGFVLPIARRHLKQPPVLRTGPAALVGRRAQVLEEVTEHGGRVRIGGEVWSARSYDETLVIPAGSAVDVMQIEGATALVYPRE